MKIIDRYVLVSFLKNYLISFMVLMGLYIVLDMIFHFDNMTSLQEGPEGNGVVSVLGVLRDIADFYFYQMFPFFVHLSGIIPVVAAAFTLMRLSRFNELTALLAAGTPLLRVALPIILGGVVLNALVVVDQELIIPLPLVTHKLTRDHDQIHQAGSTTYPIRAMQGMLGDGRPEKILLMAGCYHPPSGKHPAWMEQMDVIQRDPSLQPLAHITADKAVWDRRQGLWHLTNGWRVQGLRPDDYPAQQPCTVFKSSITPDEIALYNSSDTVELLSTDRINQLIQRPESYGKMDLLRVKHWRYTQPLANILLLLLAIPCVLTREPGHLKLAALKCCLLTGACLATMFLAHQIAGNPPALNPLWADRWPALLAWAPLLLFGPAAAWLLDRVKT